MPGAEEKPLWTPDGRRVAAANMTAFMAEVERAHGLSLESYEALYAWSVAEPERFWAAMWRFAGIAASKPWTKVLRHPDRMPGARWFEGARLNYAENLLKRRDDSEAIVFRGERGPGRRLSYAELYDEVARLAHAFEAAGLGPGDRVAAYMPNLPETIVAMLAAASIGAVFSSCSPDFGAAGVLDRFGQIAPKLLVAADGYTYNGKPVDVRSRVVTLVEGIPSIERAVIVPFLAASPDISAIPRAVPYEAFIAAAPAGPLSFRQVPFDHPQFILYSSGTTGAPKCIVHSAGGTLIQHLKELMLHSDVKRSDRIFYFTTCGWMMWNWLTSALGIGATVLLYDGSPFHPSASTLFDYAEEEGMTIFGTSAKYIASIEKAGLRPRRSHDLAALRAILSTGSPLAPESFDYVYREVKEDLCLSSISGGTDIISCFVLGNPVGPVWRGEIQARGLGMAVEIFDEDARPVRGRPGELVCTAPFPSMPVGFWDDPDGARYRAAYFERFPGVWHHGDWAEITPRGGVVIYGRSDAVLNPGGVRIGTAEIYRQVEALDEVLESLVVGQEWEGDQRVVLFVKMRDGLVLDDPLKERIRRRIRESTTPRHVPARIVQVPDIPRTRNNKISELAVREVIHGREVKNREALANPEALEHFRDLPELRT